MTTKHSDIPCMILCGGQGTRLRDVTELLPKPMVPIGEQPIIWHIMKCYAAFGVRRFILCLGYKKEAFVDYFLNYHTRTADFTIQLGHTPKITYYHETTEADWEVTLASTGLEAMTGGRVAVASRYLKPADKEFFLTYGDGVADIDIAALLTAHRQSGKLLTLSAVHPEPRFGAMKLKGNAVTGFEEKKKAAEGYVNGGFMVVNRTFIQRYLSDTASHDVYFEREPLQHAVRDGAVNAYRHEGFWQCMDNQREYLLLNALWKQGNAPWTRHWR